MASEDFSFKRRDGTGTVSIIDATTDNLLLVDGSYEQIVSNEGEWVTDKFATIATGTDPEAEIRALEELLQEAREWFKYPNKTNSIWMHVRSNAGSDRRTLIKDWGRIDKAQEKYFDPVTQETVKEIISEWEILRHPDWENPTRINSASFALDMDGDTRDMYTNDSSLNGGTEDGRVEELYIENTTADKVRELWVGIKPTGAAVTHDTKLDCDTDTILLNSSTKTTGTGSLGTQVVQTSFSTIATVARRFGNSITPKEETMFGEWVVLLRAKLTAGSSEIMARLEVAAGAGTLSAAPTEVGAEKYQDIYITSTEWVLYEMGTITLPPGMWRGATEAMYQGPGDQLLILSAERVSGTAELQSDRWYLIPHEHFFHLPEMADDIDVGAPDQEHFVFTYEDDIIEAVGENIIALGAPGARTTRVSPYQTGINAWAYPRIGGLIVAAGNIRGSGNLKHDATAQLTFTLRVHQRFKSYR